MDILGTIQSVLRNVLSGGALILSLSACGYQFQGSGSVLPPDVKKVYIPTVENLSTQPGLSLIMTEALQDRFERFGVVNIVDSRDEADAVLKVAVLNVKQNTSTTTSRTDSALEVSTQMTVGGELRRITGEVLWRTKGMQVSRAFGTTENVVVTSSSDFANASIGSSDLGNLENREVSRTEEAAAFVKLSDEVASKIYDEAVAPDF